jgi:hypothetical protein
MYNEESNIINLSVCKLIDWLIIYCLTSRSRIFHYIWRGHHCQWRAAKFRPMLGAHGLWAGSDLYRATHAVTWDLSFSGLIRRTAPFSRLLRHAWGCREPILIRIITWAVKLNMTMYLYRSTLKIHIVVHTIGGDIISSINTLIYKIAKLTMCET